MPPALGRLAPEDWTHVERYPLSAAQAVALPPRPVVIGVNWYSAFDSPMRDSRGAYWIGRTGNLGYQRGGHCVCLKPRYAADLPSWYEFYNQVNEGICVGEGVSRAASHFNRKMYQPRAIYDECKKRDGYSGEGTWVKYGFDVLRQMGAVPRKRGEVHYLEPTPSLNQRFQYSEGITENRWIRSISDCLEVLGYQNVGYVDIINSWGPLPGGYPHLTRLPVEVLERLWEEDGEIGVITDRKPESTSDMDLPGIETVI